MSAQTQKPLRTQLVAFSITRLMLNTGYRLIYPFLPVLARAVQVDLDAMAHIVTARAGLGIFAPLFGSTGDRFGRKAAMLIGMVLYFVGLLLVIIWPVYTALFLAFILGALGKIIFDPAMQAYLGDRVQYAQRGRAVAITELGWSTASIVGLPIVGWTIARHGWLAPFPALAVVISLAVYGFWRIIPPDPGLQCISFDLRGALRAILSNPAAVAGMSITLLIGASNETVNIVYGVWMEGTFGLQVAALGAASAIIGIAELGGEGLVAGWSDRIGMTRASAAGLSAITISCLVLPILGTTLSGSLLGLFLFFISFEFSFVNMVSLMTDLEPDARATLMAGNITSISIGRALGAFVGHRAFSSGIAVNSAIAALFAILALLILVRTFGVQKPHF